MSVCGALARSPARIDTIRAMLESGEHSLQSVALCVGCSRQEVHRLAQKHGIAARGGVAAQRLRNRQSRAQNNPILAIISAYQSGASFEHVGERFGISRHIVRRVLVDGDVPLRAYSERNPRNGHQPEPRWRSEDAPYPYLSDDRTDPTGLLALVNGLVPPHIPHFIRADVCQDVLVGILEGTVAPGRLKEAITTALRRVRKMHPSLYGPISLDRVIPGTDGLRLIDTIASDSEHF